MVTTTTVPCTKLPKLGQIALLQLADGMNMKNVSKYANGSTGCGKKGIEEKKNAWSEHSTEIERSLLAQKSNEPNYNGCIFHMSKKEQT